MNIRVVWRSFSKCKFLHRSLMRFSRNLSCTLKRFLSYSNFYVTKSNHWFSQSKCITDIVQKELILLNDYITPKEEQGLINEVDTHLLRQHYQTNHWDYAIKNYRELERKVWLLTNIPIIDRLRNTTFQYIDTSALEEEQMTADNQTIPFIHVLDLAENGEIMPHVDSVRFCGELVSVLSLLDDSVLRLAVAPQTEVVGLPSHRSDLAFLNLPLPGTSIDIRIPRRSLYIIRGALRYLFTHAILSNEEASKLNLENSDSKVYDVYRHRRVSIICRTQTVGSDLIQWQGNYDDLSRGNF